MSEPFLAEIRLAGFNFAPRGHAQCDGQILPINQNQSLYSLLGTTYGGDGRTTFGLPDLRGRVPVHPGSVAGNTVTQGQKTGVESVTLTAAETPNHTHTMNVATSDNANQAGGAGNALASPSAAIGSTYSATTTAPDTSLRSSAISTVGGQSHENMQPWLALNFIIAIQGLFPSRN